MTTERRYTTSEIQRFDDNAAYKLAYELKVPACGMLSTEELKAGIIFALRALELYDEETSETPVDQGQAGPAAPALVTVSYGSARESFPVAGQTVAAVLGQVRIGWNIDREALIYLNGELIQDHSRVLAAGDQLEAMRRAGQKGI